MQTVPVEQQDSRAVSYKMVLKIMGRSTVTGVVVPDIEVSVSTVDAAHRDILA